MNELRPFVTKPYMPLAANTLLLAIIDLVWAVESHWSIVWCGVVVAIVVALGLLAPLFVVRYRDDDAIRTALICSSSFILFSLAAAFFDYLLTSTNASLVDATLSNWDRLLGFDWPQVYLWTMRRPFLNDVLKLAYASVIPQIGAVILYLSFTKRFSQLAQFNAIMVLSYLITSAISMYFPAAGPAKFYIGLVHADVSALSQFEPLRDGTLKTFDPYTVQGLISIPSFHTIMAILLTFAMRRTRLFPIFFILNIAVVLSTPTVGKHYLVDLIAGAITVTATIALLHAAREPSALTRIFLGKRLVQRRREEL
jgi:hypothetical protein